MGCVTSKHLKKQAITDGWTSPPSRAVPRPKSLTSGYSVECYHRHFVSLTSTSYGSLKVESPKPAEPRFTHDRATVCSLSDMYGKLRSLETVESAQGRDSSTPNILHKSPPRACNGKVAAAHVRPISAINSSNHHASHVLESAQITPLSDIDTMHNTFAPSVPGSPSLPRNSSLPWSMSSAELGLPETINVKEMMMGLEEAAPFSQASSPAKRSHSNASTPRSKALQQHNQHLKRKADGLLLTTHASLSKKGVVPTSAEWRGKENGVGKENSSPRNGQHAIKKAAPKMASFTGSPGGTTQTSKSSSIISTTHRRDACGFTSLSQLSHQVPMQAAREIRPLRKENIVARKAAFETGSSYTNSQNENSSPGLSSTSTASTCSIHYAPSNGKVKLTLHQQQLHTPAPLQAKSMSRRLAFRGGGFTSPDLSSPTFDPDLVASYEKALSDVSQIEWNAVQVDSPKGHAFSSAKTGITNLGRPWLWSSMSMPIAALDKRLYDPLDCFKEKCPPGGENALVLYTTTLRGIRKTFEDCNMAREILQSFGLSIDERDVSMHLEFLNELRELMCRVVSVPRMFIKGRYIGGIDEVVRLHEEGKLSELVEGLPKQLNGDSCDGCGGVRFVPCLECSGSCKLRIEEDDRVLRCPDCNENGLIQCPICT